MLNASEKLLSTVQSNFSFAVNYLDHVCDEFATVAGESEGDGGDGFNPMSAGTGVLPAPAVWLKADSTTNAVLKNMKRNAKATQGKNLRSVHIH